MFGFHRPRVYRSLTGCCICGAKSSSSRFTTSIKYESEFESCFKLQERRSGEICNACVLLVKRWKKLPQNTTKNWHHVVDARSGPGTRSQVRFRQKQRPRYKSKLKYRSKSPDCGGTRDPSPSDASLFKKHRYIHKACRLRSPLPGDLSDDQGLGEERFSESSVPNSLTPSPYSSPYPSDTEFVEVTHKSQRRKNLNPIQFNPSGFIDMNYWKMERVCCGTIFRGRLGEVLIDCRLYKPCCQVKAESPVISTPELESVDSNHESCSSTGVPSEGSHSTFGDEEPPDYDDEGMESLDETYSYFPPPPQGNEDTRLLTRFQTAFVN